MIMYGAILVCIIHGFLFGLYSCLRSNSHYRNNKNIMNIFPPLPNSSKKKLTNAVFSITTLNPLGAFTIIAFDGKHGVTSFNAKFCTHQRDLKTNIYLFLWVYYNSRHSDKK